MERQGRELLARLYSDPRDQARALAVKLEHVCETLHGWTDKPPTGDESVEVHKEMLDLFIAGEELLSKRR